MVSKAPSHRKITAACTEAEYDEVFNRAWAHKQTISEYLRSLLGLAPDGWVGQRRLLTPNKDRRRTELAAQCNAEEHEVVFDRAWGERRLMSEYVREQLGFRLMAGYSLAGESADSRLGANGLAWGRLGADRSKRQ